MSAFDEWRNRFLISINSDEFNVLDECLIYVEQIALFNQICTYSNETDSFLIDTLKPAIDNILKYQITSQNRNKLGDITNFLKKSTVLFEWAFINDRFNLFEILNRITDPEMDLYKTIKKEFSGKCINLDEIKKFIIQHEYLTIMLMKIQKETNLQIDHFLFFIQTFNKVHEPMNENSKFSILFGLFEPYQSFLEKLNGTDIKDIKTNKLEDLFSNFCTLASIIDADIFQGCIEQMTFLASKFFSSPDYDNQKIGCSLFKVFAETKNEQKTEFINNTFIEALSKFQLIPKILSHNISSDNFELISPLIDQISSNDRITAKDIVEIWESFIKTDKTDSESVFNTILCILKQLKFSEVDNFFKTITTFTEKSANLNEDQKEQCSRNLETLCKLVLETLIKRENMKSETAQIMFDKLFNSAEQYIQITNNQPDDCLDFERLYTISKDDKKNNNSNINQVRKELLKNLHSRLNKKFELFIVRLLTNIAEKSTKLKEDFEEKDIDVISKYIIDLSNEQNVSNEDEIQYALYPLYTSLMNEYDKQIKSKLLEAMLKSPSDALWMLLFQVMDKSGLNNFEEDAIQVLSNFILHNYMQKSTFFLDFLKLFIFNMNEKNGVIENTDGYVYEEFRINKTPLLYENEVLEKIVIETDDESIVDHAIDICVCIYSNYTDQEEVILKLLKLFKNCIDDTNNQNIKMKMNIINLIFKYCKKTDKKKTISLISHNEVFKKSLKDKADGKYIISFEMPDNEEVKLKFNSKEISMHSLYLKISPFLHSSIQKYCICKKKGTPLSLNDKISFSYFKKLRNVKVKEIKDGVIVEKAVDNDENDTKNTKENDENKINGGGFFDNYEPIPSEYLVLNNITKSLLNILNHFDNPKIGNDENQIKLDELVYEFLSYLPTDPDLFVLSDMPDKFIPKKLMNFDYESFMNNKYSIQYILQTLLIRFNCKKYIEVYKNVIQQFLLRILAIDTSSLTFVTYMINEILRLIELLDLKSDDFILLLIRLLSLSSDNNSDECKLKIVTLLKKLIENNDSCNISDLLCNHIDILNSVLISVSNKVWEEFRNSILFELENPETLFKSIMNSLLQCNEEDMMNQINRYYTDIFSYYILTISDKTEDASEINNIVKIFMKMLRINPTSTIIDNFGQIVNKNAELLKSQDNECSLKNIIDCLINIIRLDSKPSMMSKIVELLLSLAFLDNNCQKQLSDFAEQISAYKIKGWNQVSIADQQNNKSDDDDDDDGNSSISNKEKGLKNLNQTCYMNSALQQFYHIPAFRYFISNPKQNLINNENTENKDDDNDEISIVPSLSSLFTNMELSKKSEINPEEFFTIFSSKHTNFELGKQQDCQEFVDFFIDDIKGKAHNLYEWKILTKYQRKDNNQEISSKEETFVSIPLSVESGSMKDSIKEYFTPQKLTGDNLYELSNGTKMEAILTQKIITAPPVLIFQLKRFNYDKEKQNRVKINKKFEILNNISIKQYMLNSADDNESYDYILNGVVVHAGNGSHGHYTSLIKEDIQSDNWLRYDDSSVNRIKTRKEFEKLAFGDDDDDNDQYGTNGYLLFYARENATVDVTVFDNGVIQKKNKFILDNSFPTQISQQAELDIENDNNKFLFNQCVLEKSTFAYMVNCASSVQMLKYFFGIFVHTKMFDKAKEIEDSLLNTSKTNDIKDYLQFMIDENNFKNYILPVFSELSNDKMEKASFKIIKKMISSSVDTELAGELVQNFIKNLKCIHKKWNRVCHIGSFIINYIDEKDKQCIYPIKNGWEKILLDYIFSVYEEKNSNNKNIDISTIFESLGKIISLSSTRDSSCLEFYLKLPSINEKVKESNEDSNIESYKDLIIDCISSQIFTVSDVSENFGDDFPRISFILHHQIEKAKAESFQTLFYSLMSLQGFTAYEIIDDISDESKLIKKLLVPNLQLLADILVFKDPFSQKNDMDAAKKIAKMISNEYTWGRHTMKLDEDEELKLFDMLKSEIQKIDVAYRPFFTVFNYLIQSLQIPSDTKIEGLEDLISRSGDISNGDVSNDNIDMINVEIYFHQDKLTNRCAELLDNVISSKSTDSTFDTIIQTIEFSEKNPVIFAQIISLPAWKNVIQTQSSSRNYTFISKLNATLNKIQNGVLSNVKKEDKIVRFSLVNALVFLYSLITEILDNGDHKYYANVLYLEPLVDELFENTRECINQRNKNEDEVLYIEPDFKVILDFNSYLKIIENMIKTSQRNDNKDTAMRIYSSYINHLIEKSKNFAQSIKDDDSEKLKAIKQFIEKELSSMTMKPEDVLSQTVDQEKDSYVLSLINLTYTISKYNKEFSKEMENYIKRKANGLLIMPLFKLKFCLQELIDMPEDKSSKEIVSLVKKVGKHREAFFELLLDFIMECKNQNLIKTIVNALLIDDTQMNEKSFMKTQINRGNESSNSIKEKTFFESSIQKLTDEEFDDILHQIHSKFKNALDKLQDDYELMQVTTKFLVMMQAKPQKKDDIRKLIPDGKGIRGRPAEVIKLINQND